MSRYALGMVLVALLAAPLLADSIDDAEAKRRGVPVSQVQAENALAKEKIKTAALEKQLADLQKQLAALQDPSSAPTGGTAAGATAGAAPGATPGATPVATGLKAGPAPANPPKPGSFTSTTGPGGAQTITVTPRNGGGRTITFTGTFDSNGVMRQTTQPTVSPPKP